jgi:hypothetical protein
MCYKTKVFIYKIVISFEGYKFEREKCPKKYVALFCYNCLLLFNDCFHTIFFLKVRAQGHFILCG